MTCVDSMFSESYDNSGDMIFKSLFTDKLSEFLLGLHSHAGPVDATWNIPEELIWPSGLKRRVRKKRGNRSGVRCRLKRAQRFTPLPGILLGNVRLLCHKLDELQANVSSMHEHRSRHMMPFKRGWMIQIALWIWLDRDKDTTGKECGRVVCLY